MDLKSRRLELHLTLEDVGKMVGVGKSTVRKWEQGAIKNMGRDKIVALSKALKLSPLDIIDPNHELSSDIVAEIDEIVTHLNKDRQHNVYMYAQEQLDEQNGIDISEESTRYIISGRATAAGAPLDGASQDVEQKQTVVNRDKIPRGADEVITIAGDSMEPKLPEGSQQFVHHQPALDYDGQIVIVHIKDEGITCKKVYREKDKVRLVSINEKYKDMIYPAEDVKVIGKII